MSCISEVWYMEGGHREMRLYLMMCKVMRTTITRLYKFLGRGIYYIDTLQQYEGS